MNALVMLLAQTPDEEVTLTVAGAVMMTICVGLVLVLTVFCLARILRPSSPAEHHHAPLEIDTHDRDT